MLLLVGLGNPGPKHERNRHNLGFMAVDAIARRHGITSFRSRFHGLLAEGQIAGEKVMLLKPMTYMNESGRAVGEAARYVKLASRDILVVYDELDLAFGKLKVKRGGGNAGHNGLRSIDRHLPDTDYRRLRVGIGHPGDKALVHHYILSNFAKADERALEAQLAAIAEAFPDLVTSDDDRFMNDVAMALQPPRTKRPAEGTPAKGTPAEDARAPDLDTHPAGTGKSALAAALEAAMARLRGHKS